MSLSLFFFLSCSPNTWLHSELSHGSQHRPYGLSQSSGSCPGCWSLPSVSLLEGRLSPVGLISADSVLGVQVVERQVQEWEAARQEEEEEEEAKRAEELSNALLQQEAKTMAEEGYRPKVGTYLPSVKPPWPHTEFFLSPPCVCLSQLLIPSVQRLPFLDWTADGPRVLLLQPL